MSSALESSVATSQSRALNLETSVERVRDDVTTLVEALNELQQLVTDAEVRTARAIQRRSPCTYMIQIRVSRFCLCALTF